MCQQQWRGRLRLRGAGGGGRAALCLAVPVHQRAGDRAPGASVLSCYSGRVLELREERRAGRLLPQAGLGGEEIVGG